MAKLLLLLMVFNCTVFISQIRLIKTYGHEGMRDTIVYKMIEILRIISWELQLRVKWQK